MEVWTNFLDMTGEPIIPPLESIWIRGNRKDAIETFKSWFSNGDVDPTDKVGGKPNFHIAEFYGTLEQVTRADRGCMLDLNTYEYLEMPSKTNPFGEYETLEDYLKRIEVEVIQLTNV